MSTPWSLVLRHLRQHWLRSLLTIVALTFALFLFCFVTSIVTTLEQAVSQSASNRLIVQSAVSLYVDLPLGYQGKIAGVPGAADVSKMQWFGGYYQDEANFFAQFGVDHERYFDMYARDMEIVQGKGGALAGVREGAMGREGVAEDPDVVTGAGARQAALTAMAADRRAAIVGRQLADELGWSIGDTVPIIARIFSIPGQEAWDFTIVGFYESLKANFDPRQMFFRFDYLQESLEQAGLAESLGVGVYVVNVAPGAEPGLVSAAVDALFENGPQRTKTTTEAAFQAIFVSMMGNVPLFMGTIGGAIVFAVLFSVVNTMLMAGRQRRQEQGILKALGFGDGAVGMLLLAEALLLSLLGGGLGILAAKAGEEPIRLMMGAQMSTFAIEPRTLLLAAGITVAVGVLAGLGPAIGSMRVTPVEALRSEG